MKIIIDTGQDGKVINARVRQKTATLSQWLDKDPVILDGEQAFIIRDDGTPLNFRIGDGSKRFSELPDWVAYEQGTYVPVAGSALPTLGAEIRYTWAGPGTYTQTGGPDIVVPSGNMGVLSWDGNEWSLSQSAEMPVQDVSDRETKVNAIVVNRGGYSIGVDGELYYNYYNAGYSDFIAISGTEITIHNYSTLLDNKISENVFASVFIYDDAFNFLGYLTDTTSGNVIPEKTLIKTEILSQFPSAFFIRVNVFGYADFSVTGGYSARKNVDTIHGKRGYPLECYVHKLTGELIPSVAYKCTGLLKYNGGNITVSGYSGDTLNLALVAYYRADGTFISAYNGASDGLVYNVTIPKSNVPVDTFYIRSTAGVNQTRSKVTSMGVVDSLEIYDTSKATILNINEVIKSDSPLTKDNARRSIPSRLQREGIIITYKTLFGQVTEQYKGSGTFKYDDPNWDSLQLINDLNYLEEDRGYIDRFNNVHGASNSRSKYLPLADLTIFNYSVLSVNADPNGGFASVFIYDDAFNFLGYLTDSTAGTYKVSKEINASTVIAQFPSASYIRVNAPSAKSFAISSARVPISEMYVSKVVRGNNFEKKGYVSKATGGIKESETYVHTDFLRYDGGDLIVSGISDLNFDAALIAMYDESFEYIGYITGTTQANVYNYRIKEEDINGDCRYVRATATGSISRRKVVGTTGIVYGVDEIDTTTIFSLADKKRRIDFNNYLGNSQNIHPKVLYFKDGLWGYKFWMAYTPYPFGVAEFENPCMAVSQDGLKWEAPAGMTNPLVGPPVDGYNSDTHLVWREDLERLECFFRPYNVPLLRNSIIRMTTTDGVTWSAPETIIDTDGVQMLSPSIIFEDNTYKWWWVGQRAVRYGESTPEDVGNVTGITALPINWGGTVIPWHIDVEKTDEGYEMVVQAYDTSKGQTNASSELYHVNQRFDDTFTDPAIIIHKSDIPSDFDQRGIYRACLLKINNIYFVYYTGISVTNVRCLALKYGRDILNLE